MPPNSLEYMSLLLVGTLTNAEVEAFTQRLPEVPLSEPTPPSPRPVPAVPAPATAGVPTTPA